MAPPGEQRGRRPPMEASRPGDFEQPPRLRGTPQAGAAFIGGPGSGGGTPRRPPRAGSPAPEAAAAAAAGRKPPPSPKPLMRQQQPPPPPQQQQQQWKLRRCTVVVLGDFGRSPRMQYHALSLVEQAHQAVTVVAYGGSAILPALAADARVTLCLLPPPPRALAAVRPRMLALALKALWQALSLLWALLFATSAPHTLLLQTPPCLPTFALCQLACLLRGGRLIIDWHNFAYTLMALTARRGSLLLCAAEAYERRLGRWAAAHLCVSHAMAAELRDNWGVLAEVLHDRPPAHFMRTPLPAAHALFARLDAHLRAGLFVGDCCGGAELARPGPGVRLTLMTEQMRRWQGPGAGTLASSAVGRGALRASPGGRPPLRSPSPPGRSRLSSPPALRGTPITSPPPRGGAAAAAAASASTPSLGEEEGPEAYDYCERATRPALLITSTSWTPDEDIGMLLDAAQLYDAAAAGGAYPDLLVGITGKGPLRAEFEARMARLRLRRVAFRTLWLEPADYPLLLGAADLGLSFHASSSGLDLPMKVVDMFGSGLPVAALSYPTITELVVAGKNGVLFSTAEELSAQLQTLLRGFAPGAEVGPLAALRRGARAEATRRWAGEWGRVALPLFEA